MGPIANRSDCSRIGGHVDLNVDELNVTADIRIDGIKNGLEQVRHQAPGVGVDQASVGDLKRVATIITSGLSSGGLRRTDGRGAIVTGTTGVYCRCANALLNATAAERAVASRVLLAEAADVLTQAGVLRPQHTVLDLGLRHVQALAAALGRLASWWPQPALEHRPLGDVLKVVPAADAALVVDLLVWGGWLHEQPSSGQQQQGQEGGS